MVSNVNSPLRVNGNSVFTTYKHAEMKFSHYTQPFESNAGLQGLLSPWVQALPKLQVMFIEGNILPYDIVNSSKKFGTWNSLMKIFHHKRTSVKVMILQILNNPNLKISEERYYCNIYR